MDALGTQQHRVHLATQSCMTLGSVRYAPAKSLWFVGMTTAAVIGGALTFAWAAVALFVISTLLVLLLGHSLGSHRKLVHNSYQCPRWLEYLLVYAGVHAGIAGLSGCCVSMKCATWRSDFRIATVTCGMANRGGWTLGGN